MALLHSFFYLEARNVFTAVAEKDPDCAMAHWGVAMSYYHPLWTAPSPEELELGQAAVDRALGASKQSERETAYVTISGFRWGEALPRVYRTTDLGASWTAIAGNLPDAPVQEILVAGGRVRGVELAGGERIEAPVVASSADQRTTFLALLDPATSSASVVRHVRNIKYRGSGARVHLALRGLPEFTALRDDPTLLRGAIQIAPTLTYLQRAYDCVKYGEYSPYFTQS